MLKEDWDLRETSWDFKYHPVIDADSLEAGVSAFIENRLLARKELKANEEKINRMIAVAYGLEDTKCDVTDDKLSIAEYDAAGVVKAFISYAVGCMFGRYSLKTEGLVCAGSKYDATLYGDFSADEDNIIPISDDEYFEDDIVGRFVSFIETVYCKENLQENLQFIASVLGGKGQPRDVIRSYFMNDFYSDHCNMCSITGSGKRPYYWLFDSGKKKGFRCLIYMHRYQPDTIARIRTDYVHEQQARYRNSIVKAVIGGGTEMESNEVFQSLVNYGAEAPFWALVKQATGYFEGEDSTIEKLVTHILLTATTRTLRIRNEFSGTRVYITADHGFLYTYSPLSEDSKVDKTTPSEQDVEIDRRYLITRKGATPDYLLPVKFMDDGYDAFAPRESVRIKKKGGGLNFVHGGISLQEMVVPVIEYHYLRNDSKAYQRNKAKYDTKPVEVGLLSASRKISNMIFSLNFYQKDAVGDNRSAANYLLYFVDSNGKQISDTAKIIADKTSDNGQERTFRCSFNLKSLKYDNRASYYLVIADETGLQMPQKEEFQIDIAFAVDEFDFFS